MPRWVAEIEAAGWSVEDLRASIHDVARTRTWSERRALTLSPRELRELACDALAPTAPWPPARSSPAAT
jgi:hypothetical protein